MNRATPQLRSAAKRLLLHETSRSGHADASVAALHVTDKLRLRLTMLVGTGGVQALLARALVLSAVELPWLAGVRVNANGDLEGLETHSPDMNPDTILEVRVVLLAQLLGLLVAFIGPGLTSRLLSEIWPQSTLNDLEFGEEHDHAKAK